MSRFFHYWLAVLIVPLFAITACTTPIETRVQSQASVALSEQQYRFSEKPEQNTEIYDEARSLVAKKLRAKGLVQGDRAKVLVHIAIADRPANITISAGQAEGQRVVAQEKEQKFLQSCKDREHSLKLLLIDEKSGGVAYSGSASEYHCKGTLRQSLPHLVDGALIDLGRNTDDTPRSRSLFRQGTE